MEAGKKMDLKYGKDEIYGLKKELKGLINKKKKLEKKLRKLGNIGI
jgi:hypothetical protein